MQANPDGHELGSPGRWLRLTNAGDDPVHWAVGARAPSAMPGFAIPRGEAHSITLPSLPLWAWARGGSRLLVTPTGKPGDRGDIPGATAAMILTALPVALSWPPGVTAGDKTVIAVNAGGGRAYLMSSPAQPSDLAPAETLEIGGVFVGYPHSDDAGPQVWAWTDEHAGATLLLSKADSGWQL